MTELKTHVAGFRVGAFADRLGVPGSVIFNKLNSIGALSGFLYPSYESLHTQSKEYIVDEIQTYISSHNLSVKL